VRVDPKLRHYPESRFGGFSDVDQMVIFYTRVRALLQPSFTVLEIGCGRGRHTNEQRPPVQRKLRSFDHDYERVIGIDVDPAARDNPLVDEFRLIEPGAPWPVEDVSVDLAFSDHVLEHVEDPQTFFAECHRVIKPGGYLCMRTTNAMSYYGLAARLTPSRIHDRIIQRAYVQHRQPASLSTHYRCNTVGAIRRMLDRHGFEHCVYGYQSDPAHFGFSRALYTLGVLHQRYAPRRIRTSIFVFARRL
jgi:SAM-dependent methyltransferase